MNISSALMTPLDTGGGIDRNEAHDVGRIQEVSRQLEGVFVDVDGANAWLDQRLAR